jgi:hypothetical protein
VPQRSTTYFTLLHKFRERAKSCDEGDKYYETTYAVRARRVEKGSEVETRDVDHYDALTVIRDRCWGLRCAIAGSSIADDKDRSGLQQLTIDLIESFNELCSAFAQERGLQVRKG